MKSIKVKPIQDIFSKKQSLTKNQLNQKEEEKQEKIIIDYREKTSFVPSELKSLGIYFEFKELKVGDYLVKDTIVERKTISDLVNSIINKRIFKQLEEVKQYPNYILIIEGDFDALEKAKINQNFIKGFILSVVLKYKVPIIFTKDTKETSEYLKVLLKRQEREISLNPKKRALSRKEEIEYILESFPKIGPKTAKKLLEEFGSIKNIINSSEDDLKKILKSKTINFKDIIERKY